jgi:hypothetical protein
VFDARGPERRRNDRAGLLQQWAVRPVWVDLSVLYPRARATRARPDPAGVDLASRVPGELLWWCRATTGEWIGWTCVPIAVRGRVTRVWQYVTASAFAPREDGAAGEWPGAG